MCWCQRGVNVSLASVKLGSVTECLALLVSWVFSCGLVIVRDATLGMWCDSRQIVTGLYPPVTFCLLSIKYPAFTCDLCPESPCLQEDNSWHVYVPTAGQPVTSQAYTGELLSLLPVLLSDLVTFVCIVINTNKMIAPIIMLQILTGLYTCIYGFFLVDIDMSVIVITTLQVKVDFFYLCVSVRRNFLNVIWTQSQCGGCVFFFVWPCL